MEIGRFTSPVAATSAPGDSRVFVVEQAGRIRIVGQAEPFLDIRMEVESGGERGLLNVAFAPDWAQSGRFYVFLTARGTGQVQVREYRRATGDGPLRADPATARLVLAQDHAAFSNHNGGGLAFGPDGRLWVTIGDGGGANNPVLGPDGAPSAQSDGTLLGKLLRIDPLAPDPAAGAVFHRGLRNAWRFSFDSVTGDLVIGDVGQNAREEIDVAPAAAGWLPGANWGWPCWEGTLKNQRAQPAPCDPPDDRFPSFELSHADGAVSITGGVVVRDRALPTLYGRYLYADFGMTNLRSLALRGTEASDDRAEATLPVAAVSSFGVGPACDQVLVASLDGPVYAIRDSAGSSDCGAPLPPENHYGGTAGPPVACGLRARAPRQRRRRALERRGVVVTLRAGAVRCDVELRGGIRARHVRLAADERRRVRLRLRRGHRRVLRRQLTRRRSARLTITLRATPPEDGPVTRKVLRVRVRR